MSDQELQMEVAPPPDKLEGGPRIDSPAPGQPCGSSITVSGASMAGCDYVVVKFKYQGNYIVPDSCTKPNPIQVGTMFTYSTTCYFSVAYSSLTVEVCCSDMGGNVNLQMCSTVPNVSTAIEELPPNSIIKSNPHTRSGPAKIAIKANKQQYNNIYSELQFPDSKNEDTSAVIVYYYIKDGLKYAFHHHVISNVRKRTIILETGVLAKKGIVYQAKLFYFTGINKYEYDSEQFIL